MFFSFRVDLFSDGSKNDFERVVSLNLYDSLGIFSRPQIDDIFPRKQDLTFHADCSLESLNCIKIISEDKKCIPDNSFTLSIWTDRPEETL